MTLAQFRVRRTLSHSLHEVARLIGPDRAATYLLPVCRTFLRDIDDVKVRTFLEFYTIIALFINWHGYFTVYSIIALLIGMVISPL